MSFTSRHIHSIDRRRGDRLNKKEVFRLDLAERITDFDKKFFRSLIADLNQEDVITYPSNFEYLEFKKKISKFYKVSTENIYFDSGSDACIKNFIHTFCKKGSTLILPQPSFPMYEIYAKSFGVKIRHVRYKKSFHISLREIFSKIHSNTSAIILANPGAPYGEIYGKDFILKLLDHTNRKKIPVLIDEAYIEFTYKASFSKYLNKYNNLFILRTMSKCMGFAGLRIGYIFSQKENILDIERVQLTYPVSNLSIKLSQKLLENKKEIRSYTQDTMHAKKKFVSLIKKNFFIINTETNFIYICPKNFNSQLLFDVLYKNKIATRITNLIKNSQHNLFSKADIFWIRITVGPKIFSNKLLIRILNRFNE